MSCDGGINGGVISREEQDAFALESQRRALAAINAGHFREEIVPVVFPQRKGDPIVFDTDEHPRIKKTADGYALDTSAETLARLFNLREEFTADDDKLPRRVRRAFSSGPIAGKALSDAEFEWAKRRYYEMMGWDGQTGVPSAAALARLGLDGLLRVVTTA